MHSTFPSNIPVLKACRRVVVMIVVFTLSCAAAAADLTHGYPSRPLLILVPSATGESADIIARVLSGALSKRLAQHVVIENSSGDSAINATEMAARAKADGYTLTLGSARTHVLEPLALELGYDPAEDFDPVT